VQRFLLLLILTAGLVSCSSSDPESGLIPEPTGANQVEIGKDGSNNPFAFKKEDIQQGDNGSITGGKRSQYEERADSAYARANADAPAYLQKSFHRKAWSGSQDYSTGSYRTGSNSQAETKSRFANRKSNSSNKVARAAGQAFGTGSYGTGRANENGNTVTTGSSGYVDEQARDGWRKVPILEGDEYRSISMGRAKRLLGR
jgi:hypothetical protein